MTREQLEQAAARFVEESSLNRVPAQAALRPELAGMRIYGPPLAGFAQARDPMFQALRREEAVGPQMLTPEQWLPGARSVVSLFLPFTREVRESNRAGGGDPSPQWLHGRIQGQEMVRALCLHLRDLLEAEGTQSVVPGADPRFRAVGRPSPQGEEPWQRRGFTSTWSERHAAYVCGLGTFGLSRGLITARGTAGRFGSLVTAAPFPATKRWYSGLYDACTRCGGCVRRCPAGAISLEGGKDHMACAAYLDTLRQKYAPYYGCGKCQTGVPCEACAPGRGGG